MNEEYVYVPGARLSKDQYSLTEQYLKTSDSITFFDDGDKLLMESVENDSKFKKLLYNQRIRKNRDILNIYTDTKKYCGDIKYTYLKLDRYDKKNLITDMSYYIRLFMKNNYYKYDKGVDLFFDMITRYFNDPKYTKAGYTKKTAFIEVMDWVYDPETNTNRSFDAMKNINFISVMYRLLKTNPAKIKESWKGINLVFLGKTSYFRFDVEQACEPGTPSRFLNAIKRIVNNEPVTDDEDVATKASIVDDITNSIEKSKGIKIYNLTGSGSEEDLKTVIKISDEKKNQVIPDDKPDSKENELVDKINKAAENSSDADEAITKLDKDDFAANIVDQLAAKAADNPDLSVTRTAEINGAAAKFMDSKRENGKTVREIIDTPNETKQLPSTNIHINTINNEWNDLKYINFSKAYDLDADITKIMYSFSFNKTNPITILNFRKDDTSDSETHKYTYTVKCRTASHKDFTLKFDIPKFRNSRFMKLRGNEKTMNGQLLLLPIIKTDQDTAQIVSNYNKIFIRRYGASSGKSLLWSDKVIKTLNKLSDMKYKGIKITRGDNSKISAKYELPYDYIDIGTVFTSIETENFIVYFNQDTIRELYKDKIKPDKIPVGYNKKTNTISYLEPGTVFSYTLAMDLCADETFRKVYYETKGGTKYTYSKASILNTEIPVIVICGYNIGLTKTLEKAGIGYTFVKQKNKSEFTDAKDTSIRFKDGYLTYSNTPESSLLLNGLKECDTENYELSEINDKAMWLDFLDDFGGRIKADGLDNFYDLMMDPITVSVCERYDLPTDYIDALLYANILLTDNKYNRHIDIRGNRLRVNELVAAYTYKALARSYADYSNQLKRGSTGIMTIKQSQIIDDILTDSITSDLSILSPILEIESSNTIGFKGPSGMNSDRSYSLDKRTYDASMLNVLGMSTGFAANVGINRQATLDADIEGTRGYIKASPNKEMNVAKTLSGVEAMTPYGTTGDDPFRTAMTFTQTAKHFMRTYKSDPLLVTNGADQAMPYLISDTFAYKAKKNGRIKEMNDDYIIIQYDDNTTEMVDLRSTVKKNSDGGMFVPIKLDPKSGLKTGSRVRENDIIAFDKLSFSNNIGYDDNISCDIGTMCKVALMQTDEGYNDSAIVSEWVCQAMTSDVIVEKEVTIPKNANVYNIVSKGQSVQEGDTLIIFQNAFEEKDYNILLKNLTDEDGDVSDLGRIPIRSKVTGVVEDIQILRTVEVEECSESLQKVIKKYENDVRKYKKVAAKYDADKIYDFPADYKLEPTGRLKDAKDCVKFIFYLKYKDKLAVGDKIVYYSALKGVIKSIFEEGKEPTTDFRPDEKIHSLLPLQGQNNRMVTSVVKVGLLNKIMVELDRTIKDIFDIPWSKIDDLPE